MAEASILFPLICILLSGTLTGYLYHATIVQAIQASRHLAQRPIRYIHNKARHYLRALLYRLTTFIDGKGVDDMSVHTGEYELIQSSTLHPGLILRPPDREPQSPSEEASSRTGSFDGTSVRFNSTSPEHEENGTNNMNESCRFALLHTDWYRRQSRSLHSPGASQVGNGAAIDMDPGDIPAEWELERMSRIDQGGPGAWIPRMVDRVADLVQVRFEADITHEIADSAQDV